jgi:hypothetical protein
LWFSAIQSIEGKERLAGLAPQGCFIATETIEREVGQISKTQEAACELDGMVDVRLDRFRFRAEHFFFRILGYAIGCRIAIDVDGVSAPE